MTDGGPPLRYPVNALVSYHYYRTADLAHLADVGLRLIADSGAFSVMTSGATITVDEYAAWSLRWRASVYWIASLDVIGDPAASHANYRALRSLGLDVVPTIHAGTDRSWLDRYADDGVDLVGIGGLVKLRNRPRAVLPWLVDIMRYARDNHPRMRFHGWGVFGPLFINDLPWYSVDSTTMGVSYRFGRLALFNDQTGNWRQLTIGSPDIYRVDELLRRRYGLTARGLNAAFADPDRATQRDTLTRLMTRSYQLVEDHLRRRHGPIATPTYGVAPALACDGVNVHAVIGSEFRRSIEHLRRTEGARP